MVNTDGADDVQVKDYRCHLLHGSNGPIGNLTEDAKSIALVEKCYRGTSRSGGYVTAPRSSIRGGSV
jgi:hypothetical protein